MNQSIYMLEYDFEQQNGNFLVVLRNGFEEIKSDHLTSIQLKMLQSNTIPNLLPLQVEEIDFKVKLFYNITAKRMLSQVLRERKITIKEYYDLLYHIASIVDKSNEYMLHENRYLIHEDFIFIGNDLSEVSLMYLPLQEVPEKPDLAQEMRSFAFNLVGKISELEGDGVQHLINYFNDPGFNISELKEKLDELRKRVHMKSSPKQAAAPVQPTPVQSQLNQNQASVGSMEKKATPPQSKSKPAPKATPTPQKSEKKKASNQKVTNEKKPATKKEVKSVPPDIPKQKKSIVYALIAIGLLIIWKLYEMMPSEGMLYICIGLSVLAVTGAYIYLFVPRRVKVTVDDILDGEQQAPPVSKKREKKQQKNVKNPKVKEEKQANNQALSVQPAVQAVAPVQSTQQEAATLEEENYFENLSEHTTVLSEANETTLLNEEPQSNQAQQENPFPFLEIERDGRIEKIYLTKNSFVIGRNPSSVQHVEEDTSISRMHLEFITSEGSVSIKDLGSRNGSGLNGEAIVPYKLYPLSDGDEVKVGRVKYIFKAGQGN